MTEATSLTLVDNDTEVESIYKSDEYILRLSKTIKVPIIDKISGVSNYALCTSDTANHLHNLAEVDTSIAVLTNKFLLASDKHGYQECRKFNNTAEGRSYTIKLAAPGIIAEIHRTHDSAIRYDETAEARSETKPTEVIRLLQDLIEHAHKKNCSDIGITVMDTEKHICVTYEINGSHLRQNVKVTRIETETAIEMLGALLNSYAAESGGESKENFSKEKPRDASFHIPSIDGKPKYRYAHVPTAFGLHVSIRSLASNKTGTIPTFEKQGHTRLNTKLFRMMMAMESGLIIISGPTGSGKSTTMAAGLSEVPEERKILMFEDPVETIVKNAIQVPVNEKIKGLGWSDLAVNSSRLNPNIIVNGEIRDLAIANVTIRQAAKGHLVIATLHTNNSLGIPQRLADDGLSLERLSDPNLFKGLISQRLVKTVCKSCCQKLTKLAESSSASATINRIYTSIKSEVKGVVENVNVIVKPNPDCASCGGSGFEARMPIAEVILVNTKGREFIRNGDFDGWKRYLLSKGWKDMDTSIKEAIYRGDLCPISVEGYLSSPFGVDLDNFNYKDPGAGL